MRVLSPVLAAALVLLAGCSGDDDPDPVSPRPTPSVTTPAGPSPSPSAAPDLQGVDVEVVDAERHASDPVVAQARVLLSAMTRSSNGGRIVPELRRVAAPGVVDRLEPTYREAWRNGWVMNETPVVRVERVTSQRLTLCLWNPSQAYRTEAGEPVRSLQEVWIRVRLDVAGTGDAVRFTSLQARGRCDAPPP